LVLLSHVLCMAFHLHVFKPLSLCTSFTSSPHPLCFGFFESLVKSVQGLLFHGLLDCITEGRECRDGLMNY
jgi:hypothetical protein